MIATIVSGGLSFLFVLLFTAVGTNLFKSRNIGQSIQEELTHHDHKSGTPTIKITTISHFNIPILSPNPLNK